MKSPTDHPTTDETEAIRSDINTTRHRMDETIDAIGRRLKGRHLVDEALHLFRKQQENGNMTKIKNKISESADTAYHSVVDTIKAHPVPVALVGAGVGWLIYERTRSSSGSSAAIADYRVRSYDNDFSPGALSGELPDECGCESSDTKSWAQGASSSVKEKASQAMGSLQRKASETRERLATKSAQAKESARRAYETSRQRVSTAVDEHPLQSGLACLAVGLLAGLLLPTPRRLSQSVAPKARELSDRVRDKAHDLVERGTHVVESATDAAKKEAKAQGLTSAEGIAQESSEQKNRPIAAM